MKTENPGGRLVNVLLRLARAVTGLGAGAQTTVAPLGRGATW
jgi:hypothetical protein